VVVPGEQGTTPSGEFRLTRISGSPGGAQSVWWREALMIASGSRILRYVPGEKAETFAMVPGIFGVTAAPDGSLIAVAKTVGNNTSGRVHRIRPDASIETLIEMTGYPQHVVVHKTGRIYWTSFDSADVVSVLPGEPPKKLTPGVGHSYGIGISPKQDVLYVASKAPGDWGIYAYPLAEDGTQAGARTTLMKTSQLTTPAGAPLQPVLNRLQGICVDTLGDVYFTGAESSNEGLAAVSPDGKRAIAVFRGHHNAVDCTFGGPGMRNLYAVGADGVTTITLPVAGLQQ
jgi:sugar lactone lactonase YvrE